jgi:hypothetical protein
VDYRSGVGATTLTALRTSPIRLAKTTADRISFCVSQTRDQQTRTERRANRQKTCYQALLPIILCLCTRHSLTERYCELSTNCLSSYLHASLATAATWADKATHLSLAGAVKPPTLDSLGEFHLSNQISPFPRWGCFTFGGVSLCGRAVRLHMRCIHSTFLPCFSVFLSISLHTSTVVERISPPWSSAGIQP